MLKCFQIFVLAILSFSCTCIYAQEIKRPKVGLVLSGGGAKGFAHIGVIKVLENAGVPIDYIGGTSMGSIIGALYALGYSADSLQNLVKSQDWTFLLTDKVNRKYLSFEEKEFDGKYFIPYPVSQGRFQLPSAMIAGQNLELLFSRLALQANADTNFTKFPIPFLCVATDIEAAKAEVLKSGWLTTAIRASMSIPTVFYPVVINGRTYVDGGLYNNFPVEEVKALGADIIIGVDVGFAPFYGQDLNSMLRILEQSIFTHTVAQNLERQKMCDILITPDMGTFSMMSFDAIDSITTLGELAANLYYDQFKNLADSIKKLGTRQSFKLKDIVTNVHIDQIKVEGFHKIPRSYIESKLNLKPGNVSINDIEENIRKLYGSLLFRKVSYKIEYSENKKILLIEVQERPQSVFSLGINYNTDYEASIYFNTNFYNLGIRGSKLNINAILGENPRVNAKYFVYSGWNPQGRSPFSGGWRFDFGVNAGANNYRLFEYNDGQRVSSNRFTDFYVDVYTQTVFKNSYAWGIGIMNELSFRKPDINPFRNFQGRSKLMLFHSYLKFDTYDRTYFPTNGVKLDFTAKYLTSIYNNGVEPGFMLSGNYGFAHTLHNKLSFLAQVTSGICLMDSVPDTYLYRLGGLTTHYAKNSYPFVGLQLMEVSTTQFVMIGFGLQYEILPKHFISVKTNLYTASQKLLELFGKMNITPGYSLGYGYNSPLGPLEATIMYSEKNRALFYLNLGFWF